MDSCPVCKITEAEVPLKHCTGCRSISYCCRDHQKQHWKVHKDTCSPFAVTHDPVLGRQWVATKNLKRGALVFEEKSILYCPSWEEGESVCLTCARFLDSKKPALCTLCHWPICSLWCQKHPVHAENECKIFTLQKISYPPATKMIKDAISSENENVEFFTNPVSFSIEILRGLGLAKNDGKLFAQLIKEAYKPINYFSDSLSRQVNQLRFFKKIVNLTDLEINISDHQLKIFIEASCGNKFTCPDESESDVKRAPMEGTFIKSTLINHSCAPNCQRVTRPFPEFATLIRTTVPIKKGETLTINYFREGLELEGRPVRRAEIWRYWRFNCKCQKCTSPNELGTWMDAMVCDKCRSNKKFEVNDQNFDYLLPESPEDFKFGKWKCSGCSLTISTEKIRKRIESQEEEFRLAKLIGREALKKFVEEKSGKILHANHHLILTACRNIVHSIEKQELYGESRDELYKWREFKLKLFQIGKITCPGISPMRGINMGRYGANLIATVKINSIKLNQNEKLELVHEALEYLNEALEPFKYDQNVLTMFQTRAHAISTIMERGRELLKLIEIQV